MKILNLIFRIIALPFLLTIYVVYLIRAVIVFMYKYIVYGADITIADRVKQHELAEMLEKVYNEYKLRTQNK